MTNARFIQLKAVQEEQINICFVFNKQGQYKLHVIEAVK